MMNDTSDILTYRAADCDELTHVCEIERQPGYNPHKYSLQR